MVLGISMVLKPLSVLADVIPVLGDVVGAGTGIIALLAGLALSSITIALAWIGYRPLIALVLLGVGAGAVFGVRWYAVW